ncbi:glutathionylspermidine synthase family protein [Novosphingobium sp. TH158]|uniref:glutathionylspermidine synthase family protein n=1 Tax=Novosphingobium sp. TH158 TaxID=2067455 RepID=UPI000C7D8D5A|nr:glutathionylspermidine synthase family protein [Novosphingobium sp. TH158]PLK27581.1 glutathionylspermidine synthase family protein [Novosphingobium sp. TH158]
MKRLAVQPRENWQAAVEEQGLIWHSDADGAYWDESACYSFTLAEIEAIEAAAEEVQSLYRQAGDKIAGDERLLSLCGIPSAYHDAVRQAWQRQDPMLDYGRFDFGYNGSGPPKLFEFNCDTPTSMLETAIVQWDWKEDRFPQRDQLNSLHEKLVARWRTILPRLPGGRAWFTHVDDEAHEDTITTTYMREIAMEAGCETQGVLIDQIGIDAQGRILDQDDYLITALFKLYPWEWMAVEDFGEKILPRITDTLWIEPVWKMMWSNKAVLAVLWDMFPGHPNLLPATFDAHKAGKDYVSKPVLAREGANVEVVADGRVVARSQGNYSRARLVYQERYPLRDFGPVGGKAYPVLGAWIVGGEAAGLGIREDGLITANRSRFIPHIIED